MFIGDVVAHVSPDRTFELYYPQLLSMLHKLVGAARDMGACSRWTRLCTS